MITIRIFRTRKEAEWAKEALKEGGVYSEVVEDTLWGVPIQKYKVPARFRLTIFEEDLNRSAKYLLKKIKQN